MGYGIGVTAIAPMPGGKFIICGGHAGHLVVWSIKHLREAAMTDGKKVRNMNKLILFRQFYVMVVAYIYFTRIIVFLLKSTAAYNLTWLADFASEAATLAFYLTTGYMFRPVVDNPYLHLNEDELDLEEIEMRVEEGRSL